MYLLKFVLLQIVLAIICYFLLVEKRTPKK
jgi:hypothetical protein